MAMALLVHLVVMEEEVAGEAAVAEVVQIKVIDSLE
jgi:hypothetical protein